KRSDSMTELEIHRYTREPRAASPPGVQPADVGKRACGGGGIRTRVFRVLGGASPSAAGEKVLGSPPLTGGLRRPQPRCDFPPGREARPGGEPLSMTPAIRPSGWAGTDALPSS